MSDPLARIAGRSGIRLQKTLRLGDSRRALRRSLFLGSSALPCFALLALAGCVASLPAPDAPVRGSGNYLTGLPALREDGCIHVVVEIPAGTNAKWEVDETGGAIEREMEDGNPRVVQYLAYPANYGMIPRTRLPRERGGDGDALDVVLLGSSVERGSVVPARPIGVLLLSDDGERDDKILAVPISGPLSDVSSLEELDARYPGVSGIIETWFTHYKGPGRLESRGMAGRERAASVVREASAWFEAEPG